MMAVVGGGGGGGWGESREAVGLVVVTREEDVPILAVFLGGDRLAASEDDRVVTEEKPA